MNMKKLFLISVLVLSMLLCLCACGEGEENPTTDPVNTTAPTETPTEAPTDVPTDPTDPTDPEPTYTVTVVDEAGNPVPGAIVQMCLEACVPAVTNENGVAEFFLAENDYKVSFVNIPTGYELAGEETEFYFADGENEMTITLKAAA